MSLVERFFRDATFIQVNPNDTIQRSYHHFVHYFAELESLTQHNVVIGCHFTYGWMPTMLDLRGDLSTALELLNQVKQEGARLTEEELRTLSGSYSVKKIHSSLS